MAQRGDGWTIVRKISPFYRSSSPIGAAALPAPMKTKEKVEQGKGTADHLMPLGYLFVVKTPVIAPVSQFSYFSFISFSYFIFFIV